MPLLREFAGLHWITPVPDEATILLFHRLLQEHKLPRLILLLFNQLLGAKGLLLRSPHGGGCQRPVRPRMHRANATVRRSKTRKAASGSSASRPTTH